LLQNPDILICYQQPDAVSPTPSAGFVAKRCSGGHDSLMFV
jgi:hypothetical protein